MAEEQQSQGEGKGAKDGGQIGTAAAQELKGKIHLDEQRKLAGESDAYFDSLFQAHLQEKLKPEVEAFNKEADFADALTMSTSAGLIQFFRDGKPAYALLIKHRQLSFLSPGSATPVSSLRISGGPDEFVFDGGTSGAAPIDESDALKGLIRLAAGGKFQAE